MASYVENELILAECEQRLGDNTAALSHLNNARADLEATFTGYQPYVFEDFGPSALISGATASDALLKEILTDEELCKKYKIKEVEKLSKRAANEVAVKAYEGKMNSLKETLSTINEDENLAEFIDEGKTAAVQAEIALYEKYCSKAMQELEYSKNNK